MAGFQKLSTDACYEYYRQSLECLDRNNYKKELCLDSFQAFKDCRRRQEDQDKVERMKMMEQDFLWGWLFKWLHGSDTSAPSTVNVKPQQQQQQQQQPQQQRQPQQQHEQQPQQQQQPELKPWELRRLQRERQQQQQEQQHAQGQKEAPP